MQLALTVAACFFGFISFVHLLRLLFKTQITVSGKVLPMWTSVLGFAISLAMAIWMWMAIGS